MGDPGRTGKGGMSRLPRHLWTYEQGVDGSFDRVAFFNDALFAIAMTLLIVSVELPEVRGDPSEPGSMLEPLDALRPQLLSFFLAFLLLGRYWMANHAFYAILARVDRRFIALNLVYLAFVAFLPFPTELVGKYEENPISVVLFALTLAAISGMESVLLRRAHVAGLLRHPMSARVVRYGLIQSTTPVVLFLLSIPIAFWNTSVALFSWLLSIPLGMLVDRRQRAEMGEIVDPIEPHTTARDDRGPSAD